MYFKISVTIIEGSCCHQKTTTYDVEQLGLNVCFYSLLELFVHQSDIMSQHISLVHLYFHTFHYDRNIQLILFTSD